MPPNGETSALQGLNPTNYLGEELDHYLISQDSEDHIHLGFDPVEENYVINPHQENVIVDHTT